VNMLLLAPSFMFVAEYENRMVRNCGVAACAT
jgi:hypothetical protein